MSNISNRLLIGAGIAALILFAAVRDYLPLLLFAGAGLLVILIPVAIVIAVARAIFFSQRPSTPTAARGTTAPPPRVQTTPLTDRLRSAFNRNQAEQLAQLLHQLPPWPIAAEVQRAAHTLLALKKSVYRAQAEGVPAPMVARYLTNTTQAADALWQLASKLDALGQQGVDYALVAPRLVPQEQQIAQVEQAAHAAQEAIALLIVEGIQSDALRQVDEDLSALTRAITQVAAREGAAVRVR